MMFDTSRDSYVARGNPPKEKSHAPESFPSVCPTGRGAHASSAYRVQKFEAQIRQAKEHEAYQKKLDKLEAMVLRIRDIAQIYSDKSWGRRLRSRRTQLDKVKDSAVDGPEAGPRKAGIRFEGKTTHANIVLRLRDYTKAYGENRLLEGVDLDLTSGERVALVGPNGCGKTSLLRDIMEHGHWDNPAIRIGPSMHIGYCAQQQEMLQAENTIFEEIMTSGARSHQHAREILAQFLFFEDSLEKKVKNLSGGERNRLQLARVMLQKPNVLILDEPTNHLDILTREAVEEALDDYEGTLLVVSHDRYFLEKLVTRVLEVKDKGLCSYPGSYTEFWYAREAAAREAQTKQKPKQRAPKKKAAASQTKRSGNPWKLKELEAQIAELEDQMHRCEKEATEAFASLDNKKGTELMQQAEGHKQRLEEAYEEWLGMQGN